MNHIPEIEVTIPNSTTEELLSWAQRVEVENYVGGDVGLYLNGQALMTVEMVLQGDGQPIARIALVSTNPTPEEIEQLAEGER